jgi:hypothetical protein
MIDRISFNGCRYVVGTKNELKQFCFKNNINPNWIRFKHDKYYLRLWNSYLLRGKVNEQN